MLLKTSSEEGVAGVASGLLAAIFVWQTPATPGKVRKETVRELEEPGESMDAGCA